MAQTTQDSSFGPGMAIVAYTSYMYYKTLVNMKKKKKTTHLGSKWRKMRRLDPFSLSLPSLLHIS